MLRLSYCIVFVLSSVFTLGQTGLPVRVLDIEEIGVDQGLSAGNVGEIIQDQLGYIWMVTAQGLNRYDGYAFKEFRHDPQDSFSLASNSLMYLFEDSRGLLWIPQISQGIDVFDPRTERAYHITQDGTVPGWDPGSFTNDVWEDPSGNIWFQNQNFDWFVIAFSSTWKAIPDPETLTKSMQVFPLADYIQGIGEAAYAGSAVFTSEDDIWMLSLNQLFHLRLNQEGTATELFKKYDLKDFGIRRRGLKWDDMDRFLVDEDNNTLIIFGDSSYACIDASTMQVIWNKSTPPGKSMIVPHLLDSKGRIWATRELTNLLIDPARDLVEEIRYRGPDSYNFSKVWFGRSKIEDRQGNVWCSTLGYGVYKYAIRNERFRYFGENHSRPYMSRLTEIHTGQIINSLQGTSLVDFENNQLSTWIDLDDYPIYSSALPGFHFAQDKEERMWQLVILQKDSLIPNPASRSLLLVDGDRQLIDQIRLDELGTRIDGFPFTDPKGNVWFAGGAYFTGNYRESAFKLTRVEYDEKFHAKKLEYRYSDELGNSGNLTAQAFAKDGRMYLGSAHAGVFVFDPKTESWDHIYHDPKAAKSISSNAIKSLLFDPLHGDSVLWIGTTAGLNRLNICTHEVELFDKRSGLPNDVIYGILPDHKNNLWLSTNFGLCLFNPENHSLRTFSASDGLQHNEFNTSSSLKTSDGTLYFGGVGGLTYFNPEDFYKVQDPPPVVINGLKINNEWIHFGAEARLNQSMHAHHSIENLRELELNHEQNMVTFNFAVLDYTNPLKNQFRYKLEGFKEEWINAGTENSATFTNLDPGDYTLVVQGANADGTWSTKDASIALAVFPPWWNTWWFRSLILLVLAAVLYAIYRYRLKQALKLQSVRNSIAKDLHDEIGSTLSAVSLYGTVAKGNLRKDVDQAEVILDKITDNTTQAMEAMNDIVWAVNADNDQMQHVLNRMRAFSSELVESLPIQIRFDYAPELANIQLDMEQRRNLYLVFKEAVNNAVKYADCNTIRVMIQTHGGKLTLSVQDDGRGFDQASLNGNSNLGGNGLKNMDTRAGELGGSLRVQSSKEEGTTVEMEFSLSR